MISLVNSARFEKGLKSIGFINPTLYSLGASSPGSYNDVTSGNNNCCSNSDFATTATVCCQSGFNATTGWDPVRLTHSLAVTHSLTRLVSTSQVTGWGSIYYTTFAAAFNVTATYTPASLAPAARVSTGHALLALFVAAAGAALLLAA
jgi:hypothetical protein